MDMEQLMKKLLISGVSVMLVVSATVLFLKKQSVPNTVSAVAPAYENAIATQESPSVSNSVSFEKTEDEKPRKNISDGSDSLAGTPAQEEVLFKWRQERGYLNMDLQKKAEYEKYDLATLKIMVDSGDVLAQAQLAEHYYGDDHKREIYKAMAMGSTSAVTRRGATLMSEYEDSNNDAQRNETLIEVLGLYEMGALRGDPYNQIVTQDWFIKKHAIQLTEQDKIAIKQRGKEIYNEVQQQRFELGLDEFDNTVPEAVSNYYNNLYKLTYEGAFRD